MGWLGRSVGVMRFRVARNASYVGLGGEFGDEHDGELGQVKLAN
jgi:hypothetical protein